MNVNTCNVFKQHYNFSRIQDFKKTELLCLCHYDLSVTKHLTLIRCYTAYNSPYCFSDSYEAFIFSTQIYIENLMLTTVELKYLRIFRTYIKDSLRLAGALDIDHRIIE